MTELEFFNFIQRMEREVWGNYERMEKTSRRKTLYKIQNSAE